MGLPGSIPRSVLRFGRQKKVWQRHVRCCSVALSIAAQLVGHRLAAARVLRSQKVWRPAATVHPRVLVKRLLKQALREKHIDGRSMPTSIWWCWVSS